MEKAGRKMIWRKCSAQIAKKKIERKKETNENAVTKVLQKDRFLATEKDKEKDSVKLERKCGSSGE